jgi:predicted Zn-dependent protease
MHLARRVIGLSRLAVLLLAMATMACVVSPTGRRQLILVSQGEMAALGAQSFENIKQERTVSGDARANSYVRCVAQALIDELDPEERDGWEIVVFEDPTANAFALPGRKIGVHTGMLSVAANQDQLAAVIGHEIGHVRASHGNERISQQYAAQTGLQAVSVMTDPNTETGRTTMALLGVGTQYGVLMPFGRAQETEADVMGIDLMARAGFDPAESVELWRNMAKGSGGQAPPEWMSTHPSHDSRISELSARVPAASKVRDTARAAGRQPSCSGTSAAPSPTKRLAPKTIR